MAGAAYDGIAVPVRRRRRDDEIVVSNSWR